jgi:hypothetical protein
MNTKNILKIIILTSLAVVITGCSAASEATPTLDPIAVMTQVAGTVQAQVTQASLLTPSPTIASPPTSTPFPVPTLPIPLVPTVPAGQSALPATGLPVVSPDDATWVADVETPDGTIFEGGDRFTRKFLIENSGTTTWNSGYRLIYFDGEPIICDEADKDIYLQQSVDPGNQLTIGIRMTAPGAKGTYRNYFRLINDKGEVFGDSLSVEIIVGTWEEKQAQRNS